MQMVVGLSLIALGIFLLFRVLTKDYSTMAGLKYRMLLVGSATIFFGLILILR